MCSQNNIKAWELVDMFLYGSRGWTLLKKIIESYLPPIPNGWISCTESINKYSWWGHFACRRTLFKIELKCLLQSLQASTGAIRQILGETPQHPETTVSNPSTKVIWYSILFKYTIGSEGFNNKPLYFLYQCSCWRYKEPSAFRAEYQKSRKRSQRGIFR